MADDDKIDWWNFQMDRIDSVVYADEFTPHYGELEEYPYVVSEIRKGEYPGSFDKYDAALAKIYSSYGVHARFAEIISKPYLKGLGIQGIVDENYANIVKRTRGEGESLPCYDLRFSHGERDYYMDVKCQPNSKYDLGYCFLNFDKHLENEGLIFVKTKGHGPFIRGDVSGYLLPEDIRFLKNKVLLEEEEGIPGYLFWNNTLESLAKFKEDFDYQEAVMTFYAFRTAMVMGHQLKLRNCDIDLMNAYTFVSKNRDAEALLEMIVNYSEAA